ncbi:MAG: glycosyl hydrolase family 2 [Candidatus Marinimicrobia bacterium]|nr:glycosyl hydrolase family 2 [Candidatus Neomarinimicrobiota bacterium]MCF7829864.1 glycosyl hydrolase family 2 [Candidatus Neomarinimicrobiota bacterium]MCF7879173.1 glycosyl hydrolase family 2 [Candidatus Neomarinimicrobiota bacterium]
MKIILQTGLLSLLVALEAFAIEMPAIFSDQMVLQRNAEVTVWGKAEPGEIITVTGSWGSEASAQADENGDWSVQLKTTDTGGPYSLEVANKVTTLAFEDVLLGEVWLCSGQSNMEMPMQGWPPNDLIQNSKEEISAADYPDIRLYTVERTISAQELTDTDGTWKVCTPESVAEFSATAYFFGRNLHTELGVPIGLIHASWGGTPVEAWTSTEALRTVDEMRETLEKIESSRDDVLKYNRWLASHETVQFKSSGEDRFTSLEFNDAQCANPGYDDENWRSMAQPTLWEETGMGQWDGVVWYRKNISVPPEWAGQPLTLELGPIDDMDATYFNGNLVGRNEVEGVWQKDRMYTVPGDLVKSGENLIAVRVIDTGGGGGIYGDPKEMQLYPGDEKGEALSLAGDWKYLPIAELHNGEYYRFGIETAEFFERPEVPITVGASTPSCLYNGMIAPITPLTIRGVIWYQGEANTGRPEQYKTLFPTMIRDWRDQFGQENMPFYYVQIAPYDYGPETASQRLREAQFETLSVPYTGMAVTLDIGNPDNIHPANKQDVGKRLARWALVNEYGKDAIPSGPLYTSMEKIDGKVILHFDYADGGLKITGDGSANFRIAGNDRTFYPANVKVRKSTIVVSHPEVPNPVAVRYAWDDTSAASLFNKAGLPASSFRTDDWED